MKRAQYNQSLVQTKSLLRKVGLGKQILEKDGTYSGEFMSLALHDGDYVETYQAAIRNLDYEILLNDDSFFQFGFRKEAIGPCLRYAFYQQPANVTTYEDWLEGIGFSAEDAGELFRDEYSQFAVEAEPRPTVALYRYDYSVSQYSTGIHPASHLHIGLGNHTRIPIATLLTPLAFVMFIVKHVYFPQWRALLSNQLFKRAFDRHKSHCNAVPPHLFNNQDKMELYIL